MKQILKTIFDTKKKEVKMLKGMAKRDYFENMPFFSKKIISLKEKLQQNSQEINPKSKIIAEIKRKSPSLGVIHQDFPDVFEDNRQYFVENLAKGYENAGASAISVLTDNDFFGGKVKDMLDVRQVVGIPVLMKDFMVDEIQILQAKGMGADVILLIASCLSVKEVKNLSKFAKSIGLEVLLETHTLDEIQRHICDSVDMVGINNRNLDTFEVDIENSVRLAEHIPTEFVKIAESGLKNMETIKLLEKNGFEGFLIGETFMKTPNPAYALRDFLGNS